MLQYVKTRILYQGPVSKSEHLWLNVEKKAGNE